MVYTFSKDYEITYSNIDRWLNLDLINAALIAQEMNTEYFRSFGSDNFVLRRNDNAAWVITKNRIHFNSIPKWFDVLTATASTIKTRGLRTEIQVLFTDRSGNLVFSVKQELCVIDSEARALRNIVDITYPQDMEFVPEPQELGFFRLREDLSEECLVYRDVFRTSDIDYSNHVNNVAYIRHMLNAIKPEFFEKNRIVDFEIHYHHECLEGQNYGVYLRETEPGIIDLQESAEGNPCIKARITYTAL